MNNQYVIIAGRIYFVNSSRAVVRVRGILRKLGLESARIYYSPNSTSSILRGKGVDVGAHDSMVDICTCDSYRYVPSGMTRDYLESCRRNPGLTAHAYLCQRTQKGRVGYAYLSFRCLVRHGFVVAVETLVNGKKATVYYPAA